MDYTKAERACITRALNIIAEKTAASDLAFSSPHATKEYLKLKFSELDGRREHFMVMFLNSQHGLIQSEVLFSGTVDGAAVYPRVVVQRALELNATAVVFAHNHPSGESQPSTADRRITEKLVSSCSLLDIRVLDHIIIGAVATYSFAEQGIL